MAAALEIPDATACEIVCRCNRVTLAPYWQQWQDCDRWSADLGDDWTVHGRCKEFSPMVCARTVEILALIA